MKVGRCLAGLVPVVLLWAQTGCGGGGPSGSYATVTGTVTHKGAPVPEARVTFASTTEVSGGGVAGEFTATTDSSGKFMITSVGDKPGIPPGMYKVVVTKLEMKGKFTPPEEGWDMEQLEASGMGRNILPNKYASKDSSDLTATLEEGKNEVTFDLKG